jgi:small GTP-binding protein
MRVGEGFLLVFSLTDRRSLDECMKLHRDIIRIKDRQHVPMLLVGNKSDLRQNDIEFQARAMACSMQIPYVETSARTRENIDDVFIQLVRMIRKTKCSDTSDISSVTLKQQQHSSSFCSSCTIS